METQALQSMPAPDLQEPCQWLEWDSAFFGLRVARATIQQLDAQAAAQIEEWCQARRIDCLYFLAEAADGPTVRALENHSYRLVDIRLTLRRQLDKPVVLQTRPDISLAPAVPADVAALRHIARASHSDTRFYFDPNFDRASCDRLYETWIEKSCHGYADLVLVARLHDQVAGYFSCHRLDQTHGKIGLVAVAAAARGQQVGSAVLQAGLRWFWEQNLRHISVVTQGRNVAAQRLYQNHGFVTDQVELWYHRWFRQPAPLQEGV